MKKSARLSVICGELDECELFADIGCDHGYCSEYMLDHRLCRKVQFSDISAKCLKKAETLLAAYIKEGIAFPVVCAGLEKIDPKTDLVLIAGMGGEEIVKILSEGFLPPKLLLQPMKNSDKVRSFLLQNGYGMQKDYTFFADGKFYDLIKASRAVKAEEYTRDMICFGRDNLLFPGKDFIRKLERDMRDLESWMAGAKDGKENLVARLAKLREIYSETCRRL